MKDFKILAINPGSTSTKIAVFSNEKECFSKTIRHESSEISKYKNIVDQLSFRSEVIVNSINNAEIDMTEIDAIAARGGLLKPISGGTYLVNESMLADLASGPQGQHASNLGGLIADEISKKYGIHSYIVDPVVVDELEPIARISGHKDFERQSIFHALNQKAVARIVATELGKEYEDAKFVVVHLGGGITVGVHKNGKVIDVNNGLHGEGAFSPERSGTIPFGQLIDLCFSNKFSKNEVMRMLIGGGGLNSYLGTSDCVEIQDRIKQGDKHAELIFDAMAYQVAKDVGAASTVLSGDIDAIILTGGVAHSKDFVKKITDRVGFIAKCIIKPGEDEMSALASGVYRVLSGAEEYKNYK